MPTKSKNASRPQKPSTLERIEKIRNSKAILYFTGEKQPSFGTLVAADVLPLFKEILEGYKEKPNKISLVLNTSGGHLEVPWPLVNLIREYCKTFEVIVLEKALSAGTLITLGADKIVMLPYSQLSPIDPAADIVNGQERKHIEIEDIIGYIDFAKEKIGIAEQSSLAEVMKELTREISPTMLGSVNRTHSLVRRLARNLLELHKTRMSDKQTKEIVENLTQKLYSHKHLINRREAKEIVGFGNIIEYADAEISNQASLLLTESAGQLQLNEEFDPLKILGSEQELRIKIPRALVHSSSIKFTYTGDYVVSKMPDPSGKQQIFVNNVANKWIRQ